MQHFLSMVFSMIPIKKIEELSLRTSPRTGVAIPPIFEQLRLKIRGIYSYLGDCHTSDIGHWFAMTAFGGAILTHLSP